MNPTSEYTTFRVCAPLPVAVNGGLTRWVIFRRYYGKNRVRCALYARNISSGEHLTIYDGKYSDGTEYEFGVRIAHGSMLHRIFSKLVRERRAEVVPLTYLDRMHG